MVNSLFDVFEKLLVLSAESVVLTHTGLPEDLLVFDELHLQLDFGLSACFKRHIVSLQQDVFRQVDQVGQVDVGAPDEILVLEVPSDADDKDSQKLKVI